MPTGKRTNYSGFNVFQGLKLPCVSNIITHSSSSSILESITFSLCTFYSSHLWVCNQPIPFKGMTFNLYFYLLMASVPHSRARLGPHSSIKFLTQLSKILKVLKDLNKLTKPMILPFLKHLYNTHILKPMLKMTSKMRNHYLLRQPRHCLYPLYIKLHERSSQYICFFHSLLPPQKTGLFFTCNL